MTKTELLNQLTAVCEDSDVRASRELCSYFEESLKMCESIQKEDELLRLQAEISQRISLYLMLNRYKAPKCVIGLGTCLSSSVPKERGRLSFWLMLSQSLSGLFR